RNLPRREAIQIDSSDKHASGSWNVFPVQEPHQSRFAGSRRSNEEGELTQCHMEVDILEGWASRIAFRYMLKSYHNSGTYLSLSPGLVKLRLRGSCLTTVQTFTW